MSSNRIASPYISLVLWPHGATAPEHWSAFLDRWNEQVKQYGLNAELVPAESREARNQALRRARGEFILSVAADLEPSRELLEFLAAAKLESGRFYRIDLREGSILHAREGTFTLTADGLRENAAEDIADSTSPVHFGEGWYPAERDRLTGDLFRWIGDEAEIHLRIPAKGGALKLELEPGPGLAALPAELAVVDATGARVAAQQIEGRSQLLLWPPEGTQSFRLSVPNGGRGIPADLRILNFRVFRCQCAAPQLKRPREVAARPVFTRLLRAGNPRAASSSIELLRSTGDDVFGPGVEHWSGEWHRLEQTGAERFRWLGNTAQLIVRGGELQLLVESGPSQGRRPFSLVFRLGSEIIARANVSGLTLVRVPLPLAAGTVAAITLSPEAPGGPFPGDARVLNARVLACACSLPRRAPLKLRNAAEWTSALAAQQPAGIDWPDRLRTQAHVIAEIGRPPFLHTNACDFLLMHRDLWRNLRGYPKAAISNESLDALLCYSAHFAGASEEILRPPMLLVRNRAVARHPIPHDLEWLIGEMRRFRTPAILDPEPWRAA